jgi:hypothetical protein
MEPIAKPSDAGSACGPRPGQGEHDGETLAAFIRANGVHRDSAGRADGPSDEGAHGRPVSVRIRDRDPCHALERHRRRPSPLDERETARRDLCDTADQTTTISIQNGHGLI